MKGLSGTFFDNSSFDWKIHLLNGLVKAKDDGKPVSKKVATGLVKNFEQKQSVFSLSVCPV